MPNSHDAYLEIATQNSELVCAFASMAHGITRPRQVSRALDAAIQGRSVRPLGVYPKIAEAVIERGGSYYYVTRPLLVMLALLRTRFGNRLGSNIREAMANAKRERAEAECAELSLALSVQRPERSVLAAYVKEEREALVAEEHVVEIVEEMLYAGEIK